MLTQVRHVTAATLLSVLAVQLLSVPARASCVGPVPMPTAIKDAAAVFVGTVTEVTNRRRWATVEVTDAWKSDVDTEVEVRAGPKDPPGPSSSASSIDRTYRLGQTYLFIVYRGNGSIFRDSNCSRTTRYRPGLERFRPGFVAASPLPITSAQASPRGGESERVATSDWWIWGGTIVLVVLVGAGIFLRRGRLL